MLMWFFIFGETCMPFRDNNTSSHKWVSYRLGRPTLRQKKGVVKNYFTLRADPSLKIAKWNMIWATFFHLQVWEKHSVCLCIWILFPSTCLGFDFLTYSLAAFLLQCSVHCLVYHLSCIRLLSHPTCASRQRKAHSLLSIKITLLS